MCLSCELLFVELVKVSSSMVILFGQISSRYLFFIGTEDATTNKMHNKYPSAKSGESLIINTVTMIATSPAVIHPPMQLNFCCTFPMIFLLFSESSPLNTITTTSPHF